MNYAEYSINNDNNIGLPLSHKATTSNNKLLLDDSYILSRINDFPSTRYYGSKKRLLRWIFDNVKRYDFNTALDAFGGTASVSLLFKAMGKSTAFNDALTSNCISAEALLSEANPIVSKEHAKNFIDNIKHVNGFVFKTFKGMYYTDLENKWIDGAVAEISKLTCKSSRNIYYYCLFQACLQKRPFNLFHRANLNLRLNDNVSRSFGNLTTWNKPFEQSMIEAYHDISNIIWSTGKTHTILPPSDIFDVAAEYDLVYLDPPYVDLASRHDDYLKRYHFLEGICNYDRWHQYINWGSSSNSMESIPYIKDWHRKARVREMMFDLVNKHKKSIVVLSYLANVYPSQTDIVNHFNQSFHRVFVASHELNHAMAKNKKTEILIIGVP